MLFRRKVYKKIDDSDLIIGNTICGKELENGMVVALFNKDVDSNGIYVINDLNPLKVTEYGGTSE